MDEKHESNSTTMDHLPSKTFLITAIILKCFLAVLGVLGNIAVIIHNLIIKHSKSPTDYLILNLGVADFTTCIIYYPTYVLEFGRIVNGMRINKELFCKTSISMTSSTVALSILTLLAITFDRYYFITAPLKYPLKMTKKMVFVVITSIWFLALILACILVYFTTASEK